jgi:basic amino acid/polyamine antiporter, APA family
MLRETGLDEASPLFLCPGHRVQFRTNHREVSLPLTRSIGTWGLTALVVNTIIGSGIFGIPTPLNAVVHRASPLAMVMAGLGIGLVMACAAEVSSRFSEPGGAYLYARAAFGRFVGMQVGWFSWLAPMGTSAAAANLFTSYLAAYLPFAGTAPGRATLITTLFAFLALANCAGVKVGANLSSVFTVAKILPLLLLIVLGMLYFVHHPQTFEHAQPAPPGISPWVDAMLLLSFAYGGFENAILPAGEVKDPRKTFPIALAAGLLLCIALYSLVQFVSVATIGTDPAERPLASVAELLVGSAGAAFITIAAMISTFGHLSAVQLATPRLTYSLAERHDFPAFFGRIHRRFQTPYISILIFSAITCILALSGTFRWAIAMASGALIVIYASICASLIKLRRMHGNEALLRIPFGPAVAYVCIAFGFVLLARLTLREGFLLLVTFAVATLHWLAVRNRAYPEPTLSEAGSTS